MRASSLVVVVAVVLAVSSVCVAHSPEHYQVVFSTTVDGGASFTVDVDRNLAPVGADRFYDLVKSGYFDDAGFFRVVPGFVVQFGLAADPSLTSQWKNMKLHDDPVRKTNARGTLTFATAGANTRTTQLFVNLGDNANLDRMGFAPFGRVIQGLDVFDRINSEYGEEPDQGMITSRGNDYLHSTFPRLDYIKSARIRQ